MIKKISRRSFLQACSIAAATAALTACGGGKTETAKKDDAHEAITFMAPYKEVEAFIEQVHKVYPEVNMEIVPYSGDNTTTCLQNMFAAGDLPDVCTLTYYDPQIDLVSDKLLDLSGYDFTDNYVESRLQVAHVTYAGICSNAFYLLVVPEWEGIVITIGKDDRVALLLE